MKDLVFNGQPPPGTPIDEVIAGSPTVFFEDSREGESTLKYDLTFYSRFFRKVQAGGSAKMFRVDYDVRSPYGSDIPYAPDGSTDAFDVRARFNAYQSGAYVQATTGLTSRLDVSIGGRVDNYDYLGATRLSPRASASSVAAAAISVSGWWTVVSGGSTSAATGRSSKPTTLTSAGMRNPSSRAAW